MSAGPLVRGVAELELVRARVKDAIQHSVPFGFDTETFGPEFTHAGKSRPDATRHRIAGYSLAFQDGTRYYVALRHDALDAPGDVSTVPHSDEVRQSDPLFRASVKLLRFVQQPKARVYTHNWKFDLMVLQNEGLDVRCELLDSELLAWTAGWKQPGKAGLKLKPLAARFLGWKGPTFEDVAKGRAANEVPAEEIAPYAANDAWLTLALGLKAMERVRALDSLEHWELERRCVPVSAHMERTGCKLDEERLLRHAEECEREMAAVAAQFEELTRCEVMLPHKVRVPKPCDFCNGDGSEGSFTCPGVGGKACVVGVLRHKNGNPVLHTVERLQRTLAGCDIGSDAKVSRWLFRELGWWVAGEDHELVEYGPSVKADYIRAFAVEPGKGGEAARLRLRYQALRKYASTYTRSLVALARQSGDGRLHTSYKQDGTDTVRYSSSNPNQSNLPKSDRLPLPWLADLPDIRDCFITEPGWEITIYDLNAIEMRIMAHYSRDPNLMAEFLTAGVDGHELMRQRMGGTTDRTSAKITRFSTIYRISARALAGKLRLGTNNFSITRDDAAGYIDGFYERHSGVADYHERAIGYAQRHHCAKTLTGFKRPLTEWSRDKRWGTENRAINTPIQGTAGGILKLAMAELFELWSASGMLGRDVRIVEQTYDEIGVENRIEVGEQVRADMQRVMEGVADKVGLRVPIKAAGGSGPSWSAAK